MKTGGWVVDYIDFLTIPPSYHSIYTVSDVVTCETLRLTGFKMVDRYFKIR